MGKWRALTVVPASAAMATESSRASVATMLDLPLLGWPTTANVGCCVIASPPPPQATDHRPRQACDATAPGAHRARRHGYAQPAPAARSTAPPALAHAAVRSGNPAPPARAVPNFSPRPRPP